MAKYENLAKIASLYLSSTVTQPSTTSLFPEAAAQL